ncbi:MAG: hemerythrin domain-containing protein [Dehalococcoidales bacterium]
MSDYLAKINEILEEHRTIRSGVKLVGDSVSDQEALVSLKSVRSDWTPGRLELVSEKQRKLKQTMSFLEEGLRSHFSKEQDMLPALLGEFLMQSLLLEHQEIIEKIDEVRLVATDSTPEGLTEAELESRDSEIKQKISDFSRRLEEHADKEELMLEMVVRALKAGK